MIPPVTTRLFRVTLVRQDTYSLILDAVDQEDAEAQAANILEEEGPDGFTLERCGAGHISAEELTGEEGQ